MKKAFSIVELITALVILGIVLSIAVPVVVHLIEKSKVDAFKVDEEMVVKAAKNYFISNRTLLPRVEGGTTEVSLSTLKDGNYVGPIFDPTDKSTECGGYVKVVRTSSNDYAYIPHLKCGESATIMNSTDDYLYAFYRYDDFQEPTTNLLVDNGIINWTIGNLGTTVTRTTITENSRYLITSGASSGTFRFYVPLSKLTNGKTYNLSYKYKMNSGTVFSMIDWNDQTLSNAVDTNYGSYNYASASGMKSTYDSTFHYMDFNISGNSQIEIWDVQLEEKNYGTNYTSSLRTGVVKDYSGNGETISLVESTTPKWFIDTQQKGTYSFDGLNDHMIIPDLSLTPNTFTYIVWLYPASDGSGTACLLTPNSNGLDQYLEYNYTNENITVHVAEGADTNERNISSDVGSLPKNKWSMVTFAINGLHLRLYVNGVLLVENHQTTPIALWSGNWYLGQRGNGTSYFKGYMDDLRIYKRSLLTKEILNIYNGIK